MLYWMKGLAACFGQPPRWFEGDDAFSVSQAKRICVDCPVKNICLSEALKRDNVGVWGGTTQTERRAMRRKLHAVA